jgi:hypothetical protein
VIRLGALDQEKSISNGANHDVGDILDTIFLLSGNGEIHPLPFCRASGENPKSSDWAGVLASCTP